MVYCDIFIILPYNIYGEKKAMKNLYSLTTFFALSVLLMNAQPANHVVISEVAPMGGASGVFTGGEFIELYNPTSVDITFGVNAKIASGSTTLTVNAAEWQLSLSGKTIKAYGFLLIAESDAAVIPDITFPASKNLANSGVRSVVAILEGVAVIDVFAWDASTTIAGEGTKFTPTGTTSDKKSFERKSGALAITGDTLGNAWDSNDNSKDFFENVPAKTNPQNSSSPIEKNSYGTGPASPGNASISPVRWKYNTPTTLTLIVKSPTDTIRGLQIIKPSLFTWNVGSITTIPANLSKSSSGDTVTFKNISLVGTDSIIISIASVTSTDSTDEFSLNVRLSKDSISYSGIAGQPLMLVYGSPRPIFFVKKKEANGVHSFLGKWAVTKGVITVANEFGGPSYLQDATTGMALFDSSVSNNVQRGDEVIILGKIAPFGGLFEFAPCVLLEKLSEGNPVDTLVLTANQIATQVPTVVELYEAKLVRVNGITAVATTAGQPASSWATTASGTNYNITDASGTVQTRISSKTNLANTPTPSGKFDMVGVVGEFISSNVSIYQLLPRSIDDIVPEGNGPRILTAFPYESNITSSSLTFKWVTDVPGTSSIVYGKTTALGDQVTDTNLVTTHQVTLTGLLPATIYHSKLVSANAGGSTNTSDYIVSTSSLTSTGTMNVYFSRNVNTTLARGENALTTNIATKLINRINSATVSIDLALYSLSGTVGANIANALIAAKGRGVKVRAIGEKDNQSTAPWTTLKNASIPLIDDGFDATNAGTGLMHNKFAVIDNRDSTSDIDDWVWAGSWNATDPGNDNDAQNVIEIQDKALANAYTVEFEEMWGSNTETPNALTSRFGARKYDNTPHNFVIKGTPVESYFSPSDRTNAQIIKTVNKSKYSVNFSLLTFTRSDIANALVAKKKIGVKIRGVVDNRTDSGSQYDTLLAQGMDIHLKANVPGLLHHKYAIIDADSPDSLQYIVTGSHNWSSAAENSNNENTLILRSRRLANLYLQEFSPRYTDAGGTGILLNVESINSEIPNEYHLFQNYPNPFNPSTTIQFSVAHQELVTISIFDVLGREITKLVNGNFEAGKYSVEWNAMKLSSGVYFYRMNAGNFVETRKLVFQK